jgi:hypothetical protein
MRIKEIILDAIIRTSIFEMANDKATVIHQTHSLTPVIISHLVKIFMFGKESRAFNHWCSEINAQLRRIQLNKLKSSKKPLTKEKLYDIMFDGPLGHTSTVEEWISMIWDERDNTGKYKYHRLPILQPNGVIIHRDIQRVLDKVTTDISNQIFKDIRNYL